METQHRYLLSKLIHTEGTQGIHEGTQGFLRNCYIYNRIEKLKIIQDRKESKERSTKNLVHSLQID